MDNSVSSTQGVGTKRDPGNHDLQPQVTAGVATWGPPGVFGLRHNSVTPGLE